MRIKKVSQTTPIQAQVVDAYSTSATDSYSANYVNGIFGKVLWENSSPTSDFSAQSITLSSSDYDVLELFYRSDSTGGISFSTKCLKGYSFQCEFNSTSSTNRWVRRIDRDSDTSYNVRNCIKVNDNTTANAQCVPLYVVGYKTGIFS